MIELKGKYNECKIFTDEIDNATRGQITALLDQESMKNTKIRIMPDCHAGAGCVIGTTMAIKDKLIPNLVGVDIGCGMYAIKLKEKRIDLPKLENIFLLDLILLQKHNILIFILQKHNILIFIILKHQLILITH